MTTNFPSTIQAIRIQKTGGVEVIEKSEVPFPDILPGNVVVKVHYLGINFIDTYYRQGVYQLPTFPTTLGEEAAGIIVGLPSDPNVLNDEDYKQRGFAIGAVAAVGYLGSHAEYISVPWRAVFPVPKAISPKIAAASYTQGTTAISFMTEAYNVQQGDILLVHAVAGGLGLLFTQFAKYRGAIVIGTTSTTEKAELAKANGADYVINYRKEDTVKRVLEITKGEGVHGVFDGVGKDTFDNNFKLVRRKGTIVSVGNASGVVPPFSPMRLKEKNVKLLRPMVSNYMYTAEEGRYYSTKLFRLIADGTINVRVFKEYPFTAEGLQEAHRELTSGKTGGKLVVKVVDE